MGTSQVTRVGTVGIARYISPNSLFEFGAKMRHLCNAFVNIDVGGMCVMFLIIELPPPPVFLLKDKQAK